MPTPSTLLDESRSRAGGQRALQLLVIGNGVFATHPLPAGSKVVVGRGEDADVHLPDTKASRRHARFHVGEGGVVDIEELGSANGTYVSAAGWVRRRRSRSTRARRSGSAPCC